MSDSALPPGWIVNTGVYTDNMAQPPPTAPTITTDPIPLTPDQLASQTAHSFLIKALLTPRSQLTTDQIIAINAYFLAHDPPLPLIPFPDPVPVPVSTSSNTYLMIGAVVLGGLFLMKK